MKAAKTPTKVGMKLPASWTRAAGLVRQHRKALEVHGARVRAEWS
ncbi:MAG: hypothetical protein AAB737_04130 [Patescibacteria group bacterium]